MNTIKPYGSYDRTTPNPLVRRVDVPATPSTQVMGPKRGEQLAPACKGPDGAAMMRGGDTAVPKGLIIDIWV